METLMNKSRAAALAAASLITLAACGNGGSAESESPDGAAHNDADVTFAQQMIPHHEQAVEMAELAETRADSTEVQELASQIEAAQGPEIETMTGWLQSWDEEVPSGGMSGMDHGDMSSGDMAGMMSEEEMAKMGSSSGAQFDRMFLTMMIEHHEGAIEMAQVEQEEGEFADALAMAEQIEKAQTSEIQLMEELLAG